MVVAVRLCRLVDLIRIRHGVFECHAFLCVDVYGESVILFWKRRLMKWSFVVCVLAEILSVRHVSIVWSLMIDHGE